MASGGLVLAGGATYCTIAMLKLYAGSTVPNMCQQYQLRYAPGIF